MAKSRAKKSSSSRKKKSSPRRASKSSNPGKRIAGQVQDGPTMPSSGLPADIDLLNAHRYPESMPPAFIKQVQASKACQKRLEEILKELPGGKRSVSRGFNQLFEEKRVDEDVATESGPTTMLTRDASQDQSNQAAGPRQAGSENSPRKKSGGFLRNLFK